MRIRTKLVLALLVMAVILVVPLGITLGSLRTLHARMVELRDNEFAASLLLGRMRGRIDQTRQAELVVSAIADTARHVEADGALDALTAAADSLARFGLDTTAAHLRAVTPTIRAEIDREYAAVQGQRTAEADSISDHIVRPAIAQAERWMIAGERSLRERTRDRVALTATSTEETTRVAGLALVAALLLTMMIVVWIMRSISRPITQLERGMRAIADGDLNHELAVSIRRTDEFGGLAASYRTMVAQLKELDQLKAEFVSVASHELKTPINVLVGYIQLLEEGVYGPMSAQQREVLATLEAQCQALARLARQLLDVSRFQAGGGKLDLRPVVLESFLEELERAFSVLAIQRGITFGVQRGEGLPREVLWDADRMNEVLGNLLSNAFKFTGRGGRVDLVVDAEAGLLHLEVRDTGAGIAEDELPHIFRKFFQADNQAAADAKGTGLGLAIAKEIVEAHRGSIAVESTPGVGTTFSISLPERAAVVRRPMQVHAASGSPS